MIAAKNEQLGWAPPCAGFHLSCAGHEVRLVQRTPEILCVQLQSQNAFNGSLQRRKREPVRHQLEHDRAILDLPAQPGEAGGQDAAVVGGHRGAQPQGWLRQACIARTFGHETRFVKQLITFKHPLLDPARAVEAESNPRPLKPPLIAR